MEESAYVGITLIRDFYVNACKAGDPGSNPGPGEDFSLKLLLLYFFEWYDSE